MKQEVKAVLIKDIRDKEQLYLVIGEGENKVIVNVGKKTFEAVKKLTTAEKEIKLKQSENIKMAQ